MKKIFLALGISLMAFVVGLVGTYFALPTVAPEVIDQARQQTDSAARRAAADSNPAPPDSTVTQAASAMRSPRDTLRALPNIPSDSRSQTPGSADTIRSQMAMIEELQDSVAVLNDSLSMLQSKTHGLESNLAQLRQRVKSLESTRAKAAEISKTLSRLENRELRAVLKELDMEIYEVLYAESSGRTRTRLLQSMPPQKAARLVDRMIPAQN